MLVEKTIQTSVQLTDPSQLYSSDINAEVLDVLRQRFEGVCHSSCLVLEVLEIQERSQFKFSRQRQDASATCNVRFKVRGLVIGKHEILHGCVVQKIDKDGHIICKSKNAAIYIKASKALQSIREGQTIVAVAGLVKYQLFKPDVSVNALPFIPMFEPSVVYTVAVEMRTGVVEAMLKGVDEEVEANELLNKEVYKFFIDLLYPYASLKCLNGLEGDVTPMSDVAKLKKGTIVSISTPDCLPVGDAVVLVHKSVNSNNLLGFEGIKDTSDGIEVVETFDSVFGYVVHRHREKMVALRQLCVTYSTMEMVRENSNIWEIYKRHRRA